MPHARSLTPVHAGPPWRGVLLVLSLVALLTWASAAPASAHDQLLISDPADGAVLDAPPAAVTLTFSAEILPISPTIIVRDAAGAVVVDPEPSVAGAVVTQPLPPGLPSGAYSVTWRVVSADGHPIEGTFAFTVASSASPTPSVTAAPASEVTSSAPAASASGTPNPEATTTAPAQGTAPLDVPPLTRLLIAVAAVGAVATAAILIARRRAS